MLEWPRPLARMRFGSDPSAASGRPGRGGGADGRRPPPPTTRPTLESPTGAANGLSCLALNTINYGHNEDSFHW